MYLAYKKEVISQLKETLRTIWVWERSNKGLCSSIHCFRLFFLRFCLMLSLISPKEYEYRADQRQICPILVDFSLPKRPKLFKYVSSYMLAHNHYGVWEIIFHFPKSAETFGLKINVKKTEVMYQPISESHDIVQDLQIMGQVLALVNEFKNLFLTVTNNCSTLTEELDTWISDSPTGTGGLWYN